MAVSVPRPAPLVEQLDRWGLRASWVALAVVIPFGPFVGELPPVVRFAPFLASVLLFGFPHGALDHLVPARMSSVPLVRSLAVVAGVYALLGAVYTVWWFAAPVSAFAFFILLTWGHWGQGDLYAVLAFADAGHLATRTERALAVVVRGGLPMLVPLVFHPAEYRRVAVASVGLFADTEQTLAGLFTAEARLAAGVGFGLLTLVAVGLGAWRVRRGADRRGWLIDAGEIGLLWLYFAAVPPILGIGLYFCFWHATRHLTRLALVDGATPDGARAALLRGELGAALRRLARDAAPMTLGGLAVVAVLLLAVPREASGADALLAVYLVGIAVLTLPHVAVVAWMDRRQGVW